MGSTGKAHRLRDTGAKTCIGNGCGFGIATIRSTSAIGLVLWAM